MKLVESAAELAEAWSVASSEAHSAFGDGTVFLERYVRDAKHLEVQILGDAEHAAVDPDVLPHDQDVLVPLHLLEQRQVQGLDEIQLGHRSYRRLVR